MTTDKPSVFERANTWIKGSITIRLLTIGILILLLLIPVSMVEDLIREREQRKMEAINEVSSKWGNPQTIRGLVLSIPYKTYEKVYTGEKSDKYKIVETKSYAHFLPDQLDIKGTVYPTVRYRGMYEVIVYNAKINLAGTFSSPDLAAWKIDPVNIMWEDALMSIGISDLRSIQKSISLQLNNTSYSFNPGVETGDVISNGISTRIQIEPSTKINQKLNFEVKLDFNGSSGLNFVPLGKTTKVNINSSWQSPSFDGAFLPDQREITEKGFTASWEILHLNRPYPQSFIGAITGIDESSFGVNLMLPVDEYQKSMRSAKYAVIFITLTFLIFFFVQILNHVRIHPIQYIMVGLALCVFYTLLIALTEHIEFMYSYILSGCAIIAMISLYSLTIFHSRTLTLLILGILTILYLFIYTIIQLEDYALLMGSIGLFITLALVMYLSRKINWYTIHKEQ